MPSINYTLVAERYIRITTSYVIKAVTMATTQPNNVMTSTMSSPPSVSTPMKARSYKSRLYGPLCRILAHLTIIRYTHVLNKLKRCTYVVW